MTAKEARLEERNHKCIHRNLLNRDQRLSKYPFNRSVHIKLVSFSLIADTSTDFGDRIRDGIPEKNDTICYAELIEIKELEPKQIDTLTDIIFNIGYRGPITEGSVMSCYSPRNAILFIDETGKTFDYLEICFECEQTRTKRADFDVGEFCDTKFDILKKFFVGAGIKFGTTIQLYQRK